MFTSVPDGHKMSRCVRQIYLKHGTHVVTVCNVRRVQDVLERGTRD